MKLYFRNSSSIFEIMFFINKHEFTERIQEKAQVNVMKEEILEIFWKACNFTYPLR